MAPTKTPERTRTVPERTYEEGTEERHAPDRPWCVIVWNDPVNLMSYVTWVFMKVFGYPRAKAHKLMLEVHNAGKSVVSSGRREKCEGECFRLHGYGLWATLSKTG